MKNCNLAIQVLPMHKSTQKEAYAIVDVAIAEIQKSGLKYVVCPFETVIEGSFEALMLLISNIKEACEQAGAEHLLINMKLQSSASQSVAIEDKLEKYTPA